MTDVFPHLANPWWLLLLLALPALAWHHHRRHSPGALTYSRLPLPLSGRSPAPPAAASGVAAAGGASAP